VTELVKACSEDKSKSWDERKAHTIQMLPRATEDVKKLVLADKLANLRSMARDHMEIGDELWERFNAPRLKQSWYYSGVQDGLLSLHSDENAQYAYWEMVAIYKELFVAFYTTPVEDVLYQYAAHGEIHKLEKYDNMWRTIPKLDRTDLIRITRLEAEAMEDRWHRGLLASKDHLDA